MRTDAVLRRAQWIASPCLVAGVVAATMLTISSAARADQPGSHAIPVAVLALDSEDAEDQAAALTGAVRSRVRASDGWSLTETTQSLGMLTAALKCPPRPTPECQERIGEQLKSPSYVWGFVTKGPQRGEVTAEVHLYQRNKPDTVIKRTFAENLKDQNDDALQRVAADTLAKIGEGAVGTLVVRAPANASGEVVVDAVKRVPLSGGQAHLTLAPGSHAVEIEATGVAPTKRNVLVTAGKEASLDAVSLEQASASAPSEASAPFPTKKVVGGVALGAGVVLAAFAVQQYLLYEDLQDRGDSMVERRLIPPGARPCDPGTSDYFCTLDERARLSSALAITSASVGVVAIGTGLYFLLSKDGGSREGDRAAHLTRGPRLTPTFGPRGGGLAFTTSF